MADSKITALTANTTPAVGDLLPIVDDPSGVASTQKITLENMFKVINGLTTDATPDTAADYVATYDASAGSAKKVLLSSIGGGVSGLPAGYLYGLTLTNNATDATNDIDIATGKCRDSTDAEDIILTSALTKRLDATWAVGTNQGGLDTGTVANGTYHVWLIKRSDTGVEDVLFSTSASSPTMPTNYDYKRRIGSIIRASAAILAFIQDGDRFMLKTPVQDVNVTNPGTSAVTRTLSVPTGIRVNAILQVYGGGTAASDLPRAIFINDLSLTDITLSGVNAFSVYAYVNATSSGLGGYTEAMTNTSAQVRSRVQVSTAATALIINTAGWIDTRDGGTTGGGGGSGLSDGDYGDITVGSSGTTLTIDAGAVTLAKLVDATAQYKLLGRSSSGAGDFEELTGSANVFSLLQAADYAAMLTLLFGVALPENTAMQLDAALSADGKYSGIVLPSQTAGATLAFGDLCYLQTSDSRWELVDADAESTCSNMLGMCVLAAAADGSATTMLVFGKIRADANFPALTIGAPVYASTTAGDVQVAAPSGTLDIVRKVGHALTADELFFNPSNDYYEIA